MNGQPMSSRKSDATWPAYCTMTLGNSLLALTAWHDSSQLQLIVKRGQRRVQGNSDIVDTSVQPLGKGIILGDRRALSDAKTAGPEYVDSNGVDQGHLKSGERGAGLASLIEHLCGERPALRDSHREHVKVTAASKAS